MAKIILVFCGGIFYVWCIIKNRNIYLGENEFYRTIQLERDSFSKKAGRALLDSSPLFKLITNYNLLKENIDRERISSIALSQYSDDSLSGYGDIEFDKGGSKIERQQRGLILPLLEKAMTATKSKVIVEIGTGNGDIVAYLAVKYPQHTYAGIDFSIKNAEFKHSRLGNLRFLKGYALDILENRSIQGDIVFASSTFTVFTPKELNSYLDSIGKCGFSQVILNEPTWGGFIQSNSEKAISKHMESGCWYHNYCGYLINAGYKIKEFSCFHYSHPVSLRPDIFISLINGVKS